jgi:hypothetical protein
MMDDFQIKNLDPGMIATIMKEVLKDKSLVPFLTHSLRRTMIKKRPILFGFIPIPWMLIIQLIIQAIQFFFLSKSKPAYMPMFQVKMEMDTTMDDDLYDSIREVIEENEHELEH